MTQIKVPQLGESVTEAIIAKWLKSEGDNVAADEPLVELETDKVTLEVNAPEAGTLSVISAKEGETVEVGALLGELGDPANENAKTEKPKEEPKPASAHEDKKVDPTGEPDVIDAGHDDAKNIEEDNKDMSAALSPAVRKMVNDNNLDAAQIKGTGKDGRITKEDVQNHLGDNNQSKSAAPSKPQPAEAVQESKQPSVADAPKAPRETKEREERVKMTKLRQTIASRLKEAQHEAAILTTFNEIDMGNFMDLRNQYKDGFEKRHGVKLGFMSIFVKAAVNALKEFPAVNAEIDGTDMVYKNYYDIGVAVSTPQGLVVPVVRDADQKSFATIEKEIGDLALRARDGKLSMSEMMGGTFTITNGGVFGSMMSTPILNRPQSAILGMHKTQMRPMVMKDGSIEARPMMYVALSYDHRIIDGRESVSFLVRIKEALEDPARLLIDA
jgi:2-oxoglutarate dehydrogenase E2 component (dihydrolipoamide succinyltransferase)